MVDPVVGTRDLILQVARGMVQARGYSGLSFREVAKVVGVKSASIHHHFHAKADLGAAVARAYTADFSDHLEKVMEVERTPASRLARYTGVFRNTLLSENRMCLGGMLSAEYDDLPAEVREASVAFADMNVRWLCRALVSSGTPGAEDGAIRERALAVFASVEGAQLVARCRCDVKVYDAILHGYRAAGLLP